MRSLLVFAAGAAVALTAAPALAEAAEGKKLLVVSVTKGFRHESIPTAERVVEQLAAAGNAFTVDYARTDADLTAKMTPSALAAYDGVVFASTTGDLPLPDRQGFLDWIATGRAFVGIHAATDTFPGFPPYIAMIGGQFLKHGPQVKVDLLVQDPAHPATKGMASPTTVFDEIYQMKNFDKDRVKTLLALDKHPNEGTPGFYPLAWSRQHGKGRVFYTALGHREDVLEADWFKKHLLGGILWSLGVPGTPSK
jgi:type 1 glutamine amidotransferase